MDRVTVVRDIHALIAELEIVKSLILTIKEKTLYLHHENEDPERWRLLMLEDINQLGSNTYVYGIYVGEYSLRFKVMAQSFNTWETTYVLEPKHVDDLVEVPLRDIPLYLGEKVSLDLEDLVKNCRTMGVK